MKKIRDEFTELPISRQRRWAKRKRRDGKCRVCGQPAEAIGLCGPHAVYNREIQRKCNGSGRRNLGAKSYQFDGRAPILPQ